MPLVEAQAAATSIGWKAQLQRQKNLNSRAAAALKFTNPATTGLLGISSSSYMPLAGEAKRRQRLNYGGWKKLEQQSGGGTLRAMAALIN